MMINKRKVFEYAIELFELLNQERQNVTALILGDYSRFGKSELYFLDFDITYKCGYDNNIINQCKDLNLLIELGELLSDTLNIPLKKELL